MTKHCNECIHSKRKGREYGQVVMVCDKLPKYKYRKHWLSTKAEDCKHYKTK